MKTSSKQLRNAQTGEIIVPRLEIAGNLWQQTIGLIGRREFPADTGLWLHPCNGIHTFGVRFPIDVLFLDGEGRILRTVSRLRYCRACGPMRKAKTIVELPAGTLTRLALRVGMRVEAISVPEHPNV